MGVFDFVKNAGAKIGIGTSTEEDAAAEAAAAAAQAEAATKRAEARRAARKAADDAQRAAAAKEREARFAERRDAVKKAARKAKAKERMAAYNKSNELEAHLRRMGMETDDIDIRFKDGTAYISGEVKDEATKERVILTVGNSRGVGTVDEEITVADPGPQAHFHTVAPGDTLWALAEKVYGDGSRYPEIFEANKPMLTDPDQIFPGQVLRCPLGEGDDI